MAFCVNCGKDVGDDKFCGACGTAVPAVRHRDSEGNSVEPRGKIRTDPDLICIKCGGAEFYTNWHQDNLHDLCARCDIPMGKTERGAKKERNALLWPIGIVGAIGLPLGLWLGGTFDSPEPEPAPTSASETSEKSSTAALSSTHCYNVRADVGVVNDMIETGDRDSVVFALDFQAEMADSYASQYTGEINHDLQLLADAARESSANLQNGGEWSSEKINSQVKKVLAHCN